MFDIEVNDAVRLLKKDRNVDVRGFVEDIQTFPINEEREVEINEFIVRINEMKSNKKEVDSANDSQVEKDISLD